MAWWNIVENVFKNGKQVAEVFVENKEKKGQRRHNETMADFDRDLASLGQFSNEFHQRENRTKWDSFVDGLNRLPRPLMTIAVLSFFVLAPIDPPRFLEIAKAYELIPAGYWAMLSVIIGFYFGGRMQIKTQDIAVKKDAVSAAKDLIAMKKEFRSLETGDEYATSKMFDAAVNDEALKNGVVESWLENK